MGRTIKLTAFYVARHLETRGIKSDLDIRPLADTSSELFYRFPGDRYEYYFNYGMVVFAGYTEGEMEDRIKAIAQYQRFPVTPPLRDELDLRFEPEAGIRFEFHELVLGTLNDEVYRIAMLNLAQSLALDQYLNTAENLLSEIKGFTNQLERTGKLSIRRRNMMRFIGRALNTQNSVVQNIYIFDAPELVWENELLDQLHRGLVKHFDLRMRFSEVEYMMKMIEANLTVFTGIVNQWESNLLEIIIILLILVEVLDFFINKLS